VEGKIKHRSQLVSFLEALSFHSALPFLFIQTFVSSSSDFDFEDESALALNGQHSPANGVQRSCTSASSSATVAGKSFSCVSGKKKTQIVLAKNTKPINPS